MAGVKGVLIEGRCFYDLKQALNELAFCRYPVSLREISSCAEGTAADFVSDDGAAESFDTFDSAKSFAESVLKR